MDSDRSDYRKGAIYFCILMICIVMFASPDGVPILYRLLRMLGLSPGIAIGSNVTLYVYPLIPIALAIMCIKMIFRYWHSYGVRFRGYNVFLRYFPIIVAIPVLLLFMIRV